MKFIHPFQSFQMQRNQISSIPNSTISKMAPQTIFNTPFVQYNSLKPNSIKTQDIKASSDFSLNNNTYQSTLPPIVASNIQNISSKWKNEPKRRFFTQNEDIMLTKAAVQYNEKSWNIIAQCVPGRTPRQCRDRWMNYLKPNLKFDPWTKEEDELLISLVNTHGTHWTKMISDFPGRSTNAIKNRWNWLLKDRVNIIVSPLNSKYVLTSTDIYPKKEKIENLKNCSCINHQESIESSEEKDLSKQQMHQIKGKIDPKIVGKDQIATTKDSQPINDENIFSFWQEPMNVGFDAEEVNW